MSVVTAFVGHGSKRSKLKSRVSIQCRRRMQWPLHTLANSNVLYVLLLDTAFADDLTGRLLMLALLGFMVVSSV
jgi:hypothetical protein